MIKIFRDIDNCITMHSAAEKGGRRLTEDDLSIIKNAAIVVDGKKIAWVGETKKLPRKFKKAKEVSLKGQSVLPGLVECHTHLVYAGNRSAEFEMKCQGSTYQEIAKAGGGIVNTVEATRKSTPQELLKLAQKRTDEFIKQGVTTLECKSGYGLNLKSEIQILKIPSKLKNIRAISTYLGPHALPSEFSTIDDYFKQIIKELKEVSKYTNVADIFIEKNYFSPEQAKIYFEEAKSLGMQIRAHTNQLNTSDGVDIAVEQKSLSVDHINFLTEEQIKRIARSETTAVLIPTADFYLSMRYPRARELIDNGARVALSTDFNPGTSPTQDLQFVGLLARKEMKMKLYEVINAWTVAPAHALGLQNEIGSLTPGKSADFYTLECSWKDLFYQVGFYPKSSTYLEGKKTF